MIQLQQMYSGIIAMIQFQRMIVMIVDFLICIVVTFLLFLSTGGIVKKYELVDFCIVTVIIFFLTTIVKMALF